MCFDQVLAMEFDRAIEMIELAKDQTPFNYLAFAAAG